MNYRLRTLVDTRTQIQKIRIGFDLRVKAVERGASQADTETVDEYAALQDKFDELETYLDKRIAPLVKQEPIYAQVSAIKGIGTTLAAKLISQIDIARAPHISSLWSFAGQCNDWYWQDGDGSVVAPQKGYQWKGSAKDKKKIEVIPEPKPDWNLVQARERQMSGWHSPYNQKLKTTCYLIAEQFIRQKSPYRQLYDWRHAHCEQTHPEWKPLHRHRDAMRVMMQKFIAHLWLRWRMLEGLEVEGPYVNERLGHTTYYPPEDYGWPLLNGDRPMPSVDELVRINAEEDYAATPA